MYNLNKFQNGLKELNIELTEEQMNQFIQYYETLIEWNKVMNLTAITEFDEVVQKHFIDSLALIKVVDLNKPLSILDLGTGAGFPGIPLKIAFPKTKILLLDSLNKRIKFLNTVIDELQLKNITAIHGRAEEYGQNELYREQFDLCVSRAVANLSTLSEYCMPYVKRGGYFIPYKSEKTEQEIQAATEAIRILGGKIEQVNEFQLPDTDMKRTLVVVKKALNTPKKYPRSGGKPSKEPL